MNITCDIIRDLLPLYAEDMVSDDSKKLVDGHLCTCDPCTKVLEALKKNVPIPVEADPEPLNKVRKTIRRRRCLSVLAALLTLMTLAAFVVSYLFAPFQLTVEQAIDDFYIEDGHISKKTNHAGGILGGMSDGASIFIRTAIKPTPSIFKTQQTINKSGENIDIQIKGRHDPVIVPRAVVVVESMAAITLMDALLANMTARMDRIIEFYR